MPKDLKHIKKTSEKIKEEVRSKTVGYILTALGLVAGLAWNDAVSTAINHLFPFGKNSVVAKFIYALIITTIVVAVSISLTRLISKDEKSTKE